MVGNSCVFASEDGVGSSGVSDNTGSGGTGSELIFVTSLAGIFSFIIAVFFSISDLSGGVDALVESLLEIF